MSLSLIVARIAASVRRATGRRRWLRWLPTVAAATVLVLAVTAHERRLDDRIAAWGPSTEAWVAATDLRPGDALVVSPRSVPHALRPPSALDIGVDTTALTARRHVGRGEIVTVDDVAAPGDALIPGDWRVVPVRERVPSGGQPGERVDVAAEGVVLVTDAVIVALVDEVTTVAVPADRSALVSQAGDYGVTLLRSASADD